MKVLIAGVGILILFMFGITYHSDYKNVENNELVLKTKTDEMLGGASLLWDAEEYGEGNLKVNDKEVNKLIKASLPLNVEYTLTIFDNSKKMRVYDENGLIKSQEFTSPYTFTRADNVKDYITKPSLILETEVRNKFYRMKLFGGLKEKIIRSSKYVVEGRN